MSSGWLEVRRTLRGVPGQLGKICVRGAADPRCHGPLSHGSIYSIINLQNHSAERQQLTHAGRVGRHWTNRSAVPRQSLSGPVYRRTCTHFARSSLGRPRESGIDVQCGVRQKFRWQKKIRHTLPMRCTATILGETHRWHTVRAHVCRHNGEGVGVMLSS